METEKKPLVQVKNLKKYFNTGHKEVVKALDNVSFESALPGHWRWSRSSLCSTSPSPPWMCPFRPRW